MNLTLSRKGQVLYDLAFLINLVAGVGFEEWQGAVLYILHDIAILTDEGRPVHIQGE